MTIVEAARAANAGPLIPFAIRRLCIRRAAWLPGNAIELGDDWLTWTEDSSSSGDDYEPCTDDLLADDWETVDHPLAASFDAETAAP